jgi:hypothetical protein
MNTTQPANTAAPIPLRWRIRNWLFRELFAAEYGQLHGYRMLAELYAKKEEEARARTDSRRARFVLVTAVSDQEIARRLTGTITTPVVEAVMSLIDRKIVEMSDRATNAPSETNTADLRTYEAGGANAIAEFKSRLQELTAPQEEPAKPAPASR